jgi:hypothetical protein
VAGEADLPGVVAGIAAEPFDLATEVPVRARLLAVGSGVQVLVLVLHHIGTDGWSAGVLARDLSVAYAARHQGEAPGWDRLPVQYADDAIWQRELLGDAGDPGSLLSQQAGWWRQALAGAPPELALPADRPRPAAASYRGHTMRLEIPAEVHAGLAALAREQGVTLFMVIQAALAVLLSRLGAGTDIPVGTAWRGGPMRRSMTWSGSSSTRWCCAPTCRRSGVHRHIGPGRVLAGALNQDVPFERLVDELAPDRSLAATRCSGHAHPAQRPRDRGPARPAGIGDQRGDRVGPVRPGHHHHRSLRRRWARRAARVGHRRSRPVRPGHRNGDRRAAATGPGRAGR